MRRVHLADARIPVYVSIHAPGRGATEKEKILNRLQRVSIHAPGRGATKYLGREVVANCGFNSRTREGCDDLVLLVHIKPQMFQFTHPGGVRPSMAIAYLGTGAFQFTHPGGVRLVYQRWSNVSTYVSIHAPGRGATYLQNQLISSEVVSIHAPGRGATGSKLWLRSTLRFQFTHPGGVRQYGAKLRIMGRINKRNLRLEVLL